MDSTLECTCCLERQQVVRLLHIHPGFNGPLHVSLFILDLKQYAWISMFFKQPTINIDKNMAMFWQIEPSMSMKYLHRIIMLLNSIYIDVIAMLLIGSL